MEDTIFGKIIRRELPADIVYEDEDTLAFLDINPVSPGHTLVIPKKPARNIFDIDPDSLAAVMKTVQKVALAIKAATGAEGMGISMNNERAGGQVVFHMHVHVIPRFPKDGLFMWPQRKYGNGENVAVAEKIRNALKN
jgi:histidine triad (HIT) family protein